MVAAPSSEPVDPFVQALPTALQFIQRGAQGGHPGALAHSQPLERRRPAVTPHEKLFVGQTGLTVNDALPVGIECPRTPLELERSKGCLHDQSLLVRRARRSAMICS